MLKDKSPYPRLPIKRLSKTMNRSVDRVFTSNGFSITSEQEVILRVLRTAGPMSQTELARLAGQDRNNLSRTLGLLQKKGLIIKKESNTDRRYCEINVSPEGDELHEKLLLILEDWREQLFAGVQQYEIEFFVATAMKLIENMEKMDER